MVSSSVGSIITYDNADIYVDVMGGWAAYHLD